MANWSLPTTGSTYANYTTELLGRDTDTALGLDPAYTTVTNPPTHAIRWNSSTTTWETYNGSSWGALAATYAISISGSAATAAAWQTGRTITLTGDATGASAAWTGAAGLSFATTLATVNSNVGSWGTTSSIPQFTVNAKGLITAAANVTPSGTWGISVTGNAATATALSAGLAGNLPWQSAAGVTSYLASGTSGYVLTSGGSATPVWVAQSSLSVGTAASCSGAAASLTGYALQTGLGTGSTPTFADVYLTSDETLKTDWRGLAPDLLTRFAKTRRGIYRRLDTGQDQMGTSAQSLMKSVPEMVTRREDGKLQISQSGTLVILAELAEQVQALRRWNIAVAVVGVVSGALLARAFV